MVDPPVCWVKFPTFIPSSWPVEKPGRSQTTFMGRFVMGVPSLGESVTVISRIPACNPGFGPPIEAKSTNEVADHVPLDSTTPALLDIVNEPLAETVALPVSK